MANDATFHFAWVEPEDTTFSAGAHAIEDESIFSLEIAQNEGEFATASVQVLRPDEGLLNPTRKQYAWISVTKDAATTALFFGRVVGFPRDVDRDVITLEFVSQFPGWEDDRATLFATLKTIPFWDEALIPANELENPDQALEARRALYHYDRLTGAITLSDIITGTSTDTVNDQFEGSVSWDITGSPARRVKVSATADFEQRIIDETTVLNTKIRKAFPGGVVNSFTGPSLEATWPRGGDSIGGQSGYTVLRSEIKLIDPLPTSMAGESAQFKTKISDAEQRYIQALLNAAQETRDAKLRRWWYQTELEIAYDFRQSRSETITTTIENDVQALAFDADGGEIVIDLQCEDVVSLGLHYARYSSYFQTARGKQTFHHLLARAQAALAASARCVEISFERPFFSALSVSCKNAVALEDPTLPGGTATGKIKSYRLSVDGETGETAAEITIAVSVGNGDTYTPTALDPAYVEAGYVTSGYQIQSGETAPADLPAMIYNDYSTQQPPNSPVISHLVSNNIVQAVTVTNGPEDQAALLLANQYPVRDDVSSIVNQNQTEIAVQLRSLAPSDVIEHTITVTMAAPFAAPMGIDLAA